MAKCLTRWDDPSGGPTRLCGRKLQHPGHHAAQGIDGAWALWTRDGELVMAIHREPAPEPGEEPLE